MLKLISIDAWSKWTNVRKPFPVVKVTLWKFSSYCNSERKSKDHLLIEPPWKPNKYFQEVAFLLIGISMTSSEKENCP
jgi:hypothetical protein